jgi:predicted RNase H-like HicB family nuclease
LLYAVRLRPDDNGTLLVTSRDFPELATFGEDGKEALHHAAAALTGLIESYMDRGLPIPTPRAKPGSRTWSSCPPSSPRRQRFIPARPRPRLAIRIGRGAAGTR